MDTASEARVLEKALSSRGLSHLHVVKRGKALTIATVDDDYPEARMTCIAPRMWRLDLPNHRGGWEQTPFVGDLSALVDDAMSIGRLGADG